MSKKSKFINYVNENLFSKINVDEIDEDVLTYWNGLASKDDTEKPTFTDNGKLVMKYLKNLPEGTEPMKAKDIGDEMGISSRTVSGAMRKLCDDGFVEKVGKDPVLYVLTEQGKNIEIVD